MALESDVVNHLASETAFEHVCTLVPVVSPQTQARELRRSLEGKQFESATHMGVCDNGKLVGVLRIEDLLSAPPEARVSDIMDGRSACGRARSGPGESRLESSATW